MAARATATAAVHILTAATSAATATAYAATDVIQDEVRSELTLPAFYIVGKDKMGWDVGKQDRLW